MVLVDFLEMFILVFRLLILQKVKPSVMFLVFLFLLPSPDFVLYLTDPK